MQDWFAELDQLIGQKRPELAAALLAGATPEALESLAIPVPEALKAIWRWHDGQSQRYFGSFHADSNEMLMSAAAAVESAQEFNEYVEAGDISGANWQSDWLPFTENGGGNYMCVSLTSGEVFYYDKYEVSTGIRFASVEAWLADLLSAYRKL